MALQRLSAPAPTSPLGPGTAVQTAGGAVSAFFTLECYDRRSGIAIYGLRVVNQTAMALVCRIWVVTQSAETMLACPAQFEIGPYSTIAMPVPLRPREFASFERAFAEVTGADVRCVVESAPLLQRPRRGNGFAAAACATAGMLAIAAAIAGTTALQSALPRIGAFAVPPMAMSGTTVQAEYATSGVGKLAYQIDAPDGHRVQGSTLSDRSGTIPVALPASSDSGAYTLQMTMQGPFGSAKEVRVLNAVPARHIAGAQIASIQVTPAVAKPGQPIDVSYAASGDNGYLRLTGTDGTIWSQKSLSHSGAVSFVVPASTSADQMRVVLHVTKGSSSAESSAGFAIAAAPAAHPSAQADADSADDVSADPNANGTFEVLTPNVPSGGTVRLNILSPRDHMHLAIVDGSAEESAIDVGSDAGTVTLKAPHVKVPTRYTVVANFTDGFGQESIVEPVTVRP